MVEASVTESLFFPKKVQVKKYMQLQGKDWYFGSGCLVVWSSCPQDPQLLSLF